MKSEIRRIARGVRCLAPLVSQYGGRVQAPRTRSPRKLADLARAGAWFANGNVLGIALGPKFAGGKPQAGTWSLTFFVRCKLAPSRLSPAEAIPERLPLESVGQEFLTDVRVMPHAPVAHSMALVRPLRPGIGIGNYRGTVGTIGLVVQRKDSATGQIEAGPDGAPKPYLLTCEHVARPLGAAAGDPIEQPPDSDAAVGPNVVARLSSHCTDLDTTGLRLNRADAALLELEPGQQFEREIPSIGAPTGASDLTASQMANLGTVPLLRSGAATGAGQPGTIVGLKGVFPVRMDSLGGRYATFEELVLYETRCEPGDSGGAVVNAADNTVFGLHLAGADMLGLFVPISHVFDALGCELY